MPSKSTVLQINRALPKNYCIISEMFKAKNWSFRTLCILNGYFWVIVKKQFETKLKLHKREG